MRFSINCLEITASKEIVRNNKNVYKNLLTEEEFEKPGFSLPKRFFFNDFYKKRPNESGKLVKNNQKTDSEYFFGPNINIQAIVGKNGSGKSSLLDLIYMAVNNFAYMFERGVTRTHAADLFYVDHVCANIYYSLGDQEYILKCNNDKIELEVPTDDRVCRKFSLNQRWDTWKEDEEIKRIVEPFFYTIVSNYSLQSFISSNYNQKIKVFNKTDKKTDSITNVCIDGSRKKGNDPKAIPLNASWIDSIFHKNDGYVRSIVLNPYRHYGMINMEVEKEISEYRLLALLIYDSKQIPEKRLFQDYSLETINYTIDDNFLLSKYSGFSSIEELNTYLWETEGLENKYLNRISKILNSLRMYYFDGAECSHTMRSALYYLAYKLDKIIYSYDQYKVFRNGRIKSVYKYRDSIFEEFLNIIESSHSHKVSKAKQTLHMLQANKKQTENDPDFTEEDGVLGRDYLGQFDSLFNNDSYNTFLSNTFNNIDDIIEHLAPPIFKKEIFLKKASTNEIIPIGQLSSGELQMMHTLATHAYHIRNLLSNHERGGIAYKNINMVFDEVEICFHPEYQRIFIDKLINMFHVLDNGECFFNVFIVTHSPFVLSDIPKKQVLYLEEGSSATRNSVNTFAGNVSYLLNDSFFLKAFVGEHAKKKVLSLIEALTEGNLDLVKLQKKVLNNIGDNYLKEQLAMKIRELELNSHV